MDLRLGDYSMDDFIIDDRMKIEKESEKFVNAISDEDKEKFLKLSYEEQLKAIDEYEKKYGFLEGA